jgi:uncharacterized protein YndB with AHSA1/START domain
MTTATGSDATTFSTPSDNEIMMTRSFNAPRTLVFDAFTKPEHLPHWMLGPDGWTMQVCEIDLRVGGAWRFAWSNDDGSAMELSGVYQEVQAPERLVNTEFWGDDWPETLNTLTFAEESGRTTITQTVRYPSKDARDAVLKTGMKEGMTISHNRLAAHLQTQL